MKPADLKFFAACLLALAYDAWNLATEPLRKWAKGADEWLCDYGNSDD